MPRTRAFDIGEAANQAMHVFWVRGYEATSIEDLVAATGLSRSSIYQAYGSKEGLFDAALRCYLRSVETKLAILETGGGGLDDALEFFEKLRPTSPEDTEAPLGCLMVNSIAELAETAPWIKQLGDTYQDRLRKAFIHALAIAADRGEVPADTIERRANALTFMTLGLFVAARGQAHAVIDQRVSEVVDEVQSWRPQL